MRSQNRRWVSACAARLSPGASRIAEGQHQELCFQANPVTGKGPILAGGGYRYSISNLRDGIHLGYRLRLMMDPNATNERAGAMLNRVRACIPRLRGVWARYGIRFDVAIDSDRSPEPDTVADRELRLFDDYGDPYETEMHFHGMVAENYGGEALCLQKCRRSDRIPHCVEKCEPERQKDFCMSILHEMGHHLGLTDQYPDAERCPERKAVAPSVDSFPWDVMSGRVSDWEDLDFFPADVRQILGPLCGTVTS